MLLHEERLMKTPDLFETISHDQGFGVDNFVLGDEGTIDDQRY